MTGLMFRKNLSTLSVLPYEGKAREFADFVLRTFTDHTPKLLFTSDIPDSMCEFGNDLWDEGILTLPFETCYLQTNIGADTFGYFATMIERDVAFLALMKDRGFMPVSIRSDGTLSCAASHMDDNSRHDVECLVARLIAMVAFLNTKGTKLERVAPREGVNARRERQGKRPILEYTVVKIDPEIIKSYAAKGGTHASPRPHLRRGHIRRLDEERKTVVRPSFVNASGGIIPPPQYRVEKA
jgi:hypothetical protein